MTSETMRDPSPLRSGLLHGGVSLLAFGVTCALSAGAITVFGDPAAAGPTVRVALFAPDESSEPRLNPRLQTDDRILARAPERRALAELTTRRVEPSLGVDYRNGASVRDLDVSGNETVALQSVRINGRDVRPGQSLSEVRKENLVAASAQPGSGEEQATPDPDAPRNKYAQAFENPEAKPTVSVIVGGLGINYTRTMAAINDLPEEVTLSFAPTTPNLGSWVRRARSAGHEVLIEVPMEPFDYGRARPHPNVLRAKADPATNRRQLEAYLPRNSGYLGLINFQGEQFARNAEAVAPVVDLIGDKGLALFQDASLEDSAIADAAAKSGLTFGAALTAIDARPEADEIETQLLMLEAEALENGASLGTAMPFPITIDLLTEWIERLDQKGIALAPASYYARQAGASGQIRVAALDPQG